MNWDVIVVGAGAAGLLAAARASERGRKTLLLEKNARPGVKILMSGGTRCNVTHHTNARGIVAGFGPHGKVLHTALARFSPTDLVEWLHSEGVPTKIESTGKIFPVSDRAADILDALRRRLDRSGCEVALGEPVRDIQKTADGSFQLTTPQRTLSSSRLLIATGGKSYPKSGASGDGYAWCAALGHTITPLSPALTPITTNVAWVVALQGITLPDVLVRVVEPANDASLPPAPTTASETQFTTLAHRRGSLLFAHFGLSGPAVLDVSRAVSLHPRPGRLCLECDFLPDLTPSQFESQLAAAAATSGKRSIAAIVPGSLPQRIVESLLEQAQIPAERRAAELSRAERNQLIAVVKRCRIPISGTRGFGKAEVTAGGVALEEVDFRTMESRRVPGLFLAGEILDLDGWIGGFNFQSAFSTGFLAGENL